MTASFRVQSHENALLAVRFFPLKDALECLLAYALRYRSVRALPHPRRTACQKSAAPAQIPAVAQAEFRPAWQIWFALRRAEERFLIRDIFRKQQPRGCDASGSFRIVAAQNAIPLLRRETRQRCFVRQSGLSPIQFYAHVRNVSAARAAAFAVLLFHGEARFRAVVAPAEAERFALEAGRSVMNFKCSAPASAPRRCAAERRADVSEVVDMPPDVDVRRAHGIGFTRLCEIVDKAARLLLDGGHGREGEVLRKPDCPNGTTFARAAEDGPSVRPTAKTSSPRRRR